MFKFFKTISFFLLLFLPWFSVVAQGLISIKSTNGNVKEVTDRFEVALKEKGLTLINRINHAQNAAKVGFTLKPMTLLIFGNPKVGTPLMQCNPLVAIDLPQKALIWEDEAGQVWITYNDPQYLATRHEISESCAENIAKVTNALSSIANKAAMVSTIQTH